MNVEIYILIFISAYLIGSIPFAFILLKLFQNKDIREEGTGNVGALNALRVSKSKITAISVLSLDLLKGLIPAYVLNNYFSADILFNMMLAFGLIYGHCYPIWLKFAGGRGLAVTAGVLLIFEPLLVLLWLILWGLYYIMIPNHIVSNIIASFILPFLVFLLNDRFFDQEILLLVLAVMLIIVLRHLERMPDVISEIIIKNKQL